MLELNTYLLVEMGGWPALKEARGLVEQGRVSEARQDGAVIRARVRGAEKIYDSRITLADRMANVEARCTCAESRRSGRVCAHALAAGLALLPGSHRPSARGVVSAGPSLAGQRLPLKSRHEAGLGPPPQKLQRWLMEDAPAGTTRLELTILLPLQFRESLARDPVRIILEARRDGGDQSQPFDAALSGTAGGFVVSEPDDRVLAALEQIAGAASGINAVPRGKMGVFLRALAGHPHVWLGKKDRVEVRASAQRAKVELSMRKDGALELVVDETELRGPGRSPARPGNEESAGGRRLHDLPIAGWSFDGKEILETPRLPAGFSSGARLIAPAQIPDFLTREFPALERNCDLIFAPGFEEFRLEIGQPSFEARLEGALSGLTLELIAHYADKQFPVSEKTESGAYQRYVADPRQPNRFWRRHILAEREALGQVEAAGFGVIRGGAAAFSLIQEKEVARFLANTLPRWRRAWRVTFGSRLEATMAEIDVAEPEFSLRSSSGEDWLSLDLKLSVAGQPIALDAAEIQRWLLTGQNHARAANKRILLVPTEAWSEMKEVLADCEVEQEPGRIRVARTFEPYLTGALTEQGFRPVGKVESAISIPGVKAALAPELWGQLRPYQVHGVEWLAGLTRRNFHGLLGDDMGLGKTLQALAFCAWLKSQNEAAARDRPCPAPGAAPSEKSGGQEPPPRAALIVCPTSLVTNWLREAARFTPHLRALDLTGPDRAEKLAARHDYDLLITSYAILRRDIEAYRTTEFSLVVLDEAQHIKNRSSQNAQSAKALRARHRLVLTGTPLENSVLDLWSLYDFLLPGYLGSAVDFKERYETPLTKQPEPKLMERLRQRVRPFFLRRTKEEVLTELPPKLEFPTLCELTAEQREVYRAVLAQGRREVFDLAGKAGKGRDRLAVLTTLLRLRQVCCHLDLLPTSATETKSRWKEPSTKMDRTFELIDEAMDGGHRVLLFSQFVRVLHLLREEAQRRELPFCYLDGRTVERQTEVDRFQNDAAIPLFFISLKAGGTGLNLTGADTVIHFDPWWNPAVEEQATSRAHRMGQARRVQAYKLIAAGTVEEKIQALQARKRELFHASLGGDEAFVEKLTGEDLEELLTT